LRQVVSKLRVPTRVACDVRNPLLGERGAARAFGPQKGASPEHVEELEKRLAAMPELKPVADLPGAGAAGGLGAALAALGAELVPGAPLVLELVRLRERVREADLAVTGEGTVDRSTTEGKAPGEILRVCREAGIRCALFGGRIAEAVRGAELYQLSGDPSRAREDLVALGERLGRQLME
jgi:glycerate kinase